MKSILFLTSSFLILSSASASTNIADIQKKIDKKIQLIEENKGTSTKVSVPWSVIDQREEAFWSSVVKTYDYMKSFGLTERYFFMYEAMRFTSLGHPQRIPALKEWIKREHTKLADRNIHPRFFGKWNQHVEDIKNKIEDLGEARPTVTASMTNDSKELTSFLSALKKDIGNIEVTPTIESTEKNTNTGNTTTLIGVSILSLAAGLILARKKTKKTTRVRRASPKIEAAPVIIKETPVILPDLPTEAFDNDPLSIVLEEECRKIIEDNSHLFELSQLKVHHGLRSPFNTAVYVSQEQIKEAINWLLKGTLAIANTNGKKASYLEWNCREKEGRVSLDLILHGLECDQKALYLNTLIEGDGSAPAHFSRSEIALDGHLPSVQFKTGNKRTTISLGLNAGKHHLNH